MNRSKRVPGGAWLRQMRGGFFFKPMALALTLLMMPMEFIQFSLVQPAKAASSIPHNCVQSGGNWIIQLVCQGNPTDAPPPNGLVRDIHQFETESIQRFLALHKLPNSDADVSFVYQYGRTDLRTSIRGFMEMRLADIAFKDPANRTTNESSVYHWFSDRLWAHEKHMYQSAVDDRNSWQNDRCGWKIDPDVAKSFGINYVPCVGTLEFNTAPTKDYFLTAARKREYDALLLPATSGGLRPAVARPDESPAGAVQDFQAAPATDSSNPTSPSTLTLFSMTNTELGALLGSVGAVVALTGTVIGLSRITSILHLISPYEKARANLKNRVRIGQNEEEVKANTDEAKLNSAAEEDVAAETEAAEVEAEETTMVELESASELGIELESEALAETALISGPQIVIGLVVLLVTIVATIIIEEAIAEEGLKDLDKLNNDIKVTPPDLAAFESDPMGRYKLQTIWAAAMYPDFPSHTALPAPSPSDTVLLKIPQGQNTPQLAAGLTYKDWFGNTWSPKLYGGWWERFGSKTLPDSIPVPAGQSRFVTYDSISESIRYLDWSGNEYMASRFGNNFLIFKANSDDTDQPCPVDVNSGVSQPADVSKCLSYVASSFQLLDANNNKVTLLAGVAPHITGAGNLSFVTTTTLAESPVIITGLPTPTVTANGYADTPGVGRILGALPAGVTLVPGVNPLVDGTVKFHFLGVNAVAGSYPVTIHASNGAGTADADILITISGPDLNHPITFIPVPGVPVNADWTAGKPVSRKWAVDAGGAVQFTLAGNYPPGLTFHDNGNNTATLSGTPALASPSNCNSAPLTCKIEACYGTTTGVCTTQFFNFSIASPPAATLDGPNFLKFPSALTTTYTLTTSGGAITPVTIDTPCGVAPWAAFTDNHDGTATITGTPPPGNSDAYGFRVRVATLGLAPPPDADGTPCHPLNFSIKADNTPLITSPSTATFKVGVSDRFYFTSNVPDADFALQSPLPAGLTFATFHNGTADIVGTPQAGTGADYSINYYSADSLNGNILRRTLVLKVLEAPSLTLPGTVYFMAGAPNKFTVKPSGYPKFSGMQVSRQNSPLPHGVAYNDVTNITAQAGTGTLHGTPDVATAGNDYPLTFTATNSQGTVTRSTTLHILRAGDVNRDGQVDCSDIAMVKAALNAKAGSANYNVQADINGDGVVNVLDLSFVTSKLALGTKCQ